MPEYFVKIKKADDLSFPLIQNINYLNHTKGNKD